MMGTRPNPSPCPAPRASGLCRAELRLAVAGLLRENATKESWASRGSANALHMPRPRPVHQGVEHQCRGQFLEGPGDAQGVGVHGHDAR